MFLSKFILVVLPHLSQNPGLSRTTLRIFFKFIERVFHRDISICEQVLFVFLNNYFIAVVVNIISRVTFFSPISNQIMI